MNMILRNPSQLADRTDDGIVAVQFDQELRTVVEDAAVHVPHLRARQQFHAFDVFVSYSPRLCQWKT